MRDNYKSGDLLPNGGVYIDSRQGATMGVVLARFEGYWVTWEFQIGNPRSTAHGNYFSSLTNAVEDLEERARAVMS